MKKNKSALPKYLTTVTPLSKFLAALLFIALPFIAFVFGVRYQQVKNTYQLPTECQPYVSESL